MIRIAFRSPASRRYMISQHAARARSLNNSMTLPSPSPHGLIAHPFLARSIQIATAQQRRHLSSTANSTFDNSGVVVVVSRRKWNDFLVQTQPKLKISPNNNNATGTKPEEKPWPLWSRITGAVLAGTVIPYMMVWICLTNESTRPLVLNNCGSTLEGMLRNHFGEKDMSSISYVDLKEHKDAVPLKFLGEWPESIRKEQKRIADDLQQSLRVRIKILQGTTGDMVSTICETEVDVPATEKARPENLLAKLMSSSVDKKPSLQNGAALAVDFLPSPQAVQSDDDGTLLSNNMDEFASEDGTLSNSSSSTSSIDPLREQARVYSLWHYQPVFDSNAGASSSSGSSSSRNGSSERDEMEASRLRHEIKRLQDELNTSTNRAIDDIMDEIKENKAALRRLQWKKWVPWS